MRNSTTQNICRLQNSLGYIQEVASREIYHAGSALRGMGNTLFADRTAHLLTEDDVVGIMMGVEVIGRYVEHLSEELSKAASESIKDLESLQVDS